MAPSAVLAKKGTEFLIRCRKPRESSRFFYDDDDDDDDEETLCSLALKKTEVGLDFTYVSEMALQDRTPAHAYVIPEWRNVNGSPKKLQFNTMICRVFWARKDDDYKAITPYSLPMVEESLNLFELVSTIFERDEGQQKKEEGEGRKERKKETERTHRAFFLSPSPPVVFHGPSPPSDKPTSTNNFCVLLGELLIFYCLSKSDLKSPNKQKCYTTTAAVARDVVAEDELVLLGNHDRGQAS
ncbi:hypothetical protein TURU_085897 [Turdus rufiventris]|nr:hypothetical protein TURU_085897 [Turdus rufiventris]